MGLWGEGGWGSVGTLDATNQLRLWSHDNFGEDLIMNVRAGGIYYWDESGWYWHQSCRPYCTIGR